MLAVTEWSLQAYALQEPITRLPSCIRNLGLDLETLFTNRMLRVEDDCMQFGFENSCACPGD